MVCRDIPDNREMIQHRIRLQRHNQAYRNPSQNLITEALEMLHLIAGGRRVARASFMSNCFVVPPMNGNRKLSVMERCIAGWYATIAQRRAGLTAPAPIAVLSRKRLPNAWPDWSM